MSFRPDLLTIHESLDLLDLDQVPKQKTKSILFKQNNQSPTNFEFHMYHPTEMANASTPTSWFYSLYLHTPERYNDNDHLSRLDMSFLFPFQYSTIQPILQFQSSSISHVTTKQIIHQKH